MSPRPRLSQVRSRELQKSGAPLSLSLQLHLVIDSPSRAEEFQWVGGRGVARARQGSLFILCALSFTLSLSPSLSE